MDKRVRAVLSLLDREYIVPPDLHILAGRLGLGLSRLEHLFKRDTGQSMRDYIRGRRVAAAAEMLASTGRRISEIGCAVGFPDSANFTHAFKERFGVCPREYRMHRRIEQLLPSPSDANQREQSEPRDHD